MQARKIFTPSARPQAALAPVLKIFTAYENLSLYGHARKVQEQFERLCNGEAHICTDALSFALFERERSWAHALAEAATADVIIISVSGSVDLPPSVQRWMEAWPSRDQSGQAALVTVFPHEVEIRPDQQFLSAYFKQIAERGRLDFICNLNERKNSDSGTQKLIANESFTMFTRSPYENWGLNE